MAANPSTNWNMVDAGLPDQPIQAFIPGTKHGTREVFEEKVLLEGCKDSGALDAIKVINGGDEDAPKRPAWPCAPTDCRSISTAIIPKRWPGSRQISTASVCLVCHFMISFYDNNTKRLQVATMSGVVPTSESIAAGQYPVSRPIYSYIKAAHLDAIPG